jgi:FkbM family methyltransferase
MSFRLAKSLLDRPGGRTLLGQLVTTKAYLRGNGAKIFYDGCWIHRFGTDFFADWRPNTKRNLHSWLEQERRHWLTFYRPKSGDIIIEVGAGVGIEAILFSRAIGEAGRVVAIEAHPRTYECLLKTCEYNSLTNVTPLNIALVDREQAVFLEDNPQHIGNAVTPDATGPIRVRGRKLDDVCAEQGISQIALIRMNIEGAEQYAVRGMDKMIANTAHAAIACHDFKADRTRNEFFRTKKLITEFLADHDFRIVQLDFKERWAKDHVYAYNAKLTSNPLELA